MAKGVYKPRKDLVGKRFGKLTVLEYAGYELKGKTAKHKWKCICDCGNEIVTKGVLLNEKHKMSCGCLSHKPKNASHKHYMTDTPLYNVWKSMKGRCYTKGNSAYKHYGARGIRVCEEWRNDFMPFYNWAISQGYTEENRRNCTIDRIDYNGNYCPENCRLATYKEQAKNTRKTKRFEINGEYLTRTEIAEKYGIPYKTLKGRMDYGMSLENALNYEKKNKYMITINGITKSLLEWCKDNGIKECTAYGRIHRGWNPEDAVTKPLVRNYCD